MNEELSAILRLAVPTGFLCRAAHRSDAGELAIPQHLPIILPVVTATCMNFLSGRQSVDSIYKKAERD